jgi:hypothetical protein
LCLDWIQQPPLQVEYKTNQSGLFQCM